MRNAVGKALPRFAIVGFDKSGTTALKANLNKHPVIFIPDMGNGHSEVDYFKIPGWKKGDYLNLFKMGKVNGDNSKYIRDKRYLEMLKEINPNMKIIVCIRHPIKMLESFYNMCKELGLPEYKNVSFNRIILENQIVQGVNYFMFANYLKYIRKLHQIFPRKQVHIVIQEAMMRDTKGEIDKIYEFIGIRPVFGLKYGTFHKRSDKNNKHQHIDYKSKDRKKCIRKLYRHYKLLNERLFKYLGYRISSWDAIDKQYDSIII